MAMYSLLSCAPISHLSAAYSGDVRTRLYAALEAISTFDRRTGGASEVRGRRAVVVEAKVAESGREVWGAVPMWLTWL